MMEFKKEKIATPLVATPTHNVSQAIKYGNLVFVSGMVGEDEKESFEGRAGRLSVSRRSSI